MTRAGMLTRVVFAVINLCIAVCALKTKIANTCIRVHAVFTGTPLTGPTCALVDVAKAHVVIVTIGTITMEAVLLVDAIPSVGAWA